MAKSKTSIVLPGLSRSTTCKTTSCRRLDGHRGDHRTTLRSSVAAVIKPKASVRRTTKSSKFTPERGVEVHSADRYEVQPDSVRPARPAKARKARPAKPVCRVSKGGIRCDRLSGHKTYGLRHRFTGLVTIVPEAESQRMVADSANGQHRTARRAAAAPKGRRDVTIRESLGIE